MIWVLTGIFLAIFITGGLFSPFFSSILSAEEEAKQPKVDLYI